MNLGFDVDCSGRFTRVHPTRIEPAHNKAHPYLHERGSWQKTNVRHDYTYLGENEVAIGVDPLPSSTDSQFKRMVHSNPKISIMQ